jgi:hypothetical protein
MYALAKANQLEQEATIEREVIGAQYFECPDIECGAVFSYCRVSCGRFVQPDFCPICGGPMKAAEEILRTICQTGSAPEDDSKRRMLTAKRRYSALLEGESEDKRKSFRASS